VYLNSGHAQLISARAEHILNEVVRGFLQSRDSASIRPKPLSTTP
jgi:hypothetical protein